jgi:hypothetical protein
MERVAFLLEHTGERLSCLLNPESVVLRRLAGVKTRRSASGILTGGGLADDQLLYTGGGRTELELDLLFDVSLAGSSMVTEDVRELTAPLWRLSENTVGEDGYRRPPLVRFVWGKAWNIPGIVAAVAERLEYFTDQGVPRRSWLRMRFLRVEERTQAPGGAASRSPSLELLGRKPTISPDQALLHGHGSSGGSGEGEFRISSAERLDEVADRHYGDPSLWRLLADLNGIDDPMHIPDDLSLRVLPLSALENPR